MAGVLVICVEIHSQNQSIQINSLICRQGVGASCYNCEKIDKRIMPRIISLLLLKKLVSQRFMKSFVFHTALLSMLICFASCTGAEKPKIKAQPESSPPSSSESPASPDSDSDSVAKNSEKISTETSNDKGSSKTTPVTNPRKESKTDNRHSDSSRSRTTEPRPQDENSKTPLLGQTLRLRDDVLLFVDPRVLAFEVKAHHSRGSDSPRTVRSVEYLLEIRYQGNAIVSIHESSLSSPEAAKKIFHDADEKLKSLTRDAISVAAPVVIKKSAISEDKVLNSSQDILSGFLVMDFLNLNASLSDFYDFIKMREERGVLKDCRTEVFPSFVKWKTKLPRELKVCLKIAQSGNELCVESKIKNQTEGAFLLQDSINSPSYSKKENGVKSTGSKNVFIEARLNEKSRPSSVELDVQMKEGVWSKFKTAFSSELLIDDSCRSYVESSALSIDGIQQTYSSCTLIEAGASHEVSVEVGTRCVRSLD
jgi:hypothetical protein